MKFENFLQFCNTFFNFFNYFLLFRILIINILYTKIAQTFIRNRLANTPIGIVFLTLTNSISWQHFANFVLLFFTFYNLNNWYFMYKNCSKFTTYRKADGYSYGILIWYEIWQISSFDNSFLILFLWRRGSGSSQVFQSSWWNHAQDLQKDLGLASDRRIVSLL